MVKRVTSRDQNQPRPGEGKPPASAVVKELSQVQLEIYNAVAASPHFSPGRPRFGFAGMMVFVC